MLFDTIATETTGRVALIRLDRPKALNALSDQLLTELGKALDAFEANDGIGAIVLTGSEKAFAAGADIKEMATKGFVDALNSDFAAKVDRVARCRKPVIAAVAGFALGGGCELAMACDFILAADTARFGQPEITLGIMPGMGGTQRLTRLVGRAKAMEMILTGRMIDAAEAERAGLVARVVPADKLLDEALAAAEKIADFSAPIVRLAKESVNQAEEMSLADGIRFERRVFYAMFATEDQKEGMAAFTEKRTPHFNHR
ncbi:enoyl-CoA hydratase [Methylobrevis albus]|uniref:enoyl-CoA hydratase n=1 Tax=Methylobrevis albus TaxID=2793297 RepID=A0A931I3S4_9HYPH|nr:enoyl-CoA hydratase [Methylobrevis albus]MBH0238730.1 enoyl-CoA hydratase [Methylobrevis albus]